MENNPIPIAKKTPNLRCYKYQDKYNLTPSSHLNHLKIAVIRRPNTSNTLIETRHGFLLSLRLFTTGLFEQIGPFQDFIGFEIANGYRLFTAVYVVASDEGVFGWSRGNADFNLGVCAGEGWEFIFKEGAVEQD
jgi:hypothetical protein